MLDALPGLEGICFSPGSGASLPRILFWTETFHTDPARLLLEKEEF